MYRLSTIQYSLEIRQGQKAVKVHFLLVWTTQYERDTVIIDDRRILLLRILQHTPHFRTCLLDIIIPLNKYLKGYLRLFIFQGISPAIYWTKRTYTSPVLWEICNGKVLETYFPNGEDTEPKFHLSACNRCGHWFLLRRCSNTALPLVVRPITIRAYHWLR